MKGTGALKLKVFFIIVYGQENLCQEIYWDASHTTDPATEKNKKKIEKIRPICQFCERKMSKTWPIISECSCQQAIREVKTSLRY